MLMKILFAASECLPFIKTGGLADVAGTLPKAISELNAGADIRVILPKFKRIPEKYRFNMRHVFDTTVYLGWREQYLGLDEYVLDGVTYWFVDNEYYFGGDFVYGEGDFETERFCFFCKAVMESLKRLDFIPDVIHANDWQTGFIPMLVHEYAKRPDFANIRTCFTIHNLKFQGWARRSLVDDLLSLGSEALDGLESGGSVSAMRAAIRYSGKVTTVSPTYAREILTPEFGEGLDGMLRFRAADLIGILNGISNSMYDPMTDAALAKHYDAKSLAGKTACKKALLKELGLEVNEKKPLFAVISRLTDQKGMDKVLAITPELLERGSQIVILGMGDERYEGAFRHYDRASPNFAFRAEMNDELARRIYAGSDIFLMPSVFEPCGISQLLSLRYGCIPLVRETGGLADTVRAYNRFDKTGNGFSFGGYEYSSFKEVVELALGVYSNKREWNALVRRAMACDNDWRLSAEKYLQMYGWLF